MRPQILLPNRGKIGTDLKVKKRNITMIFEDGSKFSLTINDRDLNNYLKDSFKTMKALHSEVDVWKSKYKEMVHDTTIRRRDVYDKSLNRVDDVVQCKESYTNSVTKGDPEPYVNANQPERENLNDTNINNTNKESIATEKKTESKNRMVPKRKRGPYLREKFILALIKFRKPITLNRLCDSTECRFGKIYPARSKIQNTLNKLEEYGIVTRSRSNRYKLVFKDI